MKMLQVFDEGSCSTSLMEGALWHAGSCTHRAVFATEAMFAPRCALTVPVGRVWAKSWLLLVQLRALWNRGGIAQHHQHSLCYQLKSPN